MYAKKQRKTLGVRFAHTTQIFMVVTADQGQVAAGN